MSAQAHHAAAPKESLKGDEWRVLGRAGLDNAPVRWHDQHGERRGRARDIAPDGALIVDSGGAGGATERILSGEVTWETST